MKENQILTLNDVKKLNKQKNPIVILNSTKGQDPVVINKLKNHVQIRIIGGYSDDIYKNTKYYKRTFYTPKQVSLLIIVYQQIESGIDPSWSNLQKAYYLFLTLVAYMKYNEQSFCFNKWSEKQIVEPFLDKKGEIVYKNFVVKLFNESQKQENTPPEYRNLCTLLSRSSHCAGFANCYKEGLDRLGIENTIIHLPNVHTFNKVKIDDDNSILVDLSLQTNYMDLRLFNKKSISGTKHFGNNTSFNNYLKINFPNHFNEFKKEETDKCIKLSYIQTRKLETEITHCALAKAAYGIEAPNYIPDKLIAIKDNTAIINLNYLKANN